MKQIIRYLYEYENGDRIRNVGFIKVEKQLDKCMINIHGKSLDFGEEKKLEVYVFYMRNGKCIGASQGAIENVAPVINYILKFEAEDVGGGEAFENIAGLLLLNDSGKKYVAAWTEEEIDIEGIDIDGTDIEGIAIEGIDIKGMQSLQGESEESVDDEEPEEKFEEQDEKEKETVETAEPVRESLIEHVEKLVEEQELQETLEEAEEVEEYIPPATRTYEKIQRKDLSRLPRKEWRLANNSFLLHGFYNYHHLLYIEEGEYSWIGVPGIFHEKEQAAARAFGFSQFHRITDADIELSAEERNTFDDFGYWCRQVER